jgi:antitoxin component YwqK of YwqJK toxin-antitoxin module
MKTNYFILTLFFCAFTLVGISQTEPPKNYTGEWVTKYKSGKVNFKGKYVNGKQDGPCVYYFENGTKRFEGSYKNGLKEGVWKAYFDTGQMRFKANYKNGDQVGDRIYY